MFQKTVLFFLTRFELLLNEKQNIEAKNTNIINISFSVTNIKIRKI